MLNLLVSPFIELSESVNKTHLQAQASSFGTQFLFYANLFRLV